MAIDIFSTSDDLVIKGKFLYGQTNYEFAIQYLCPLIDKLPIQRNLQDSRFYRRLERDLLKGCIMPAVTLAFVVDFQELTNEKEILSFINSQIHEAFVLDGIQRLNTLKRTLAAHGPKFDLSRTLYVNILLCESMDNLLYRMITLNNGQRPMTVRHQIEILAENIMDFETLTIKVQKEKGKKRAVNGAFKKADVIRAYIAYLSNSVTIESQKIIEEKMDELIAGRIFESNITEDDVEFQDIIDLMARFSEHARCLRWFRINNNLIGFCVGSRKSFNYLQSVSAEAFAESIESFELAFDAFDPSKFNVGQLRRKLVAFFISNYEKAHDLGRSGLLSALMEVDTTFS